MPTRMLTGLALHGYGVAGFTGHRLTFVSIHPNDRKDVTMPPSVIWKIDVDAYGVLTLYKQQKPLNGDGMDCWEAVAKGAAIHALRKLLNRGLN